MANIGVVCEGSHDYCFLIEVLDQILIEAGYTNNKFHALQPRVDATSMQLDGGGYESVRQWLIANSAISLRNFFAPVLFSSSTSFDAIVVQMDGDVADICTKFGASVYAGPFQNVADRVGAIRSWILSLAKVEPRFAGSVIAAVPTLKMEAWVIGAISNSATQIEVKSRKKAAKRMLRKRFSGSAVEQVKGAGAVARGALSQMRTLAVSFDIFHSDVRRRF
ncbi:hypothetical protein ACYZX9_12890 [Sphingomonas citri]